MKTYCKNIDLTDPKVILPWVLDCLQGDGKRKAKWKRRDFQHLMAHYCQHSVQEIRAAVKEHDMNVLLEAAQGLAEETAARIQRRELDLRPIRYFKRVDVSSRKEREISNESPMQQVFDFIAISALMPMLRAKILPHQYASIRGRGQAAGKRRLERWVRRDKNCRYYVKGILENASRALSGPWSCGC